MTSIIKTIIGQNSPFTGILPNCCSIAKLASAFEKNRINYPRVRVLLIFCIAQKTTRAEQPRYNLPWLEEPAVAEANLLSLG